MVRHFIQPLRNPLREWLPLLALGIGVFGIAQSAKIVGELCHILIVTGAIAGDRDSNRATGDRI